MSKYLEFSIIERKLKTKVIGVYSKRSGDKLAIIKWYGAWRQYAFFPERNTLYNTECLNDIISYIKELR